MTIWWVVFAMISVLFKEQYIKFGFTIIYLEDVLKTVAFYEKAFGFERGMVFEEDGVVDYAELKTGDTAAIGFAQYDLGEMNFGGRYIKETLNN